MPEQAYKRCRICETEKPLSEFNRNSKQQDGHDTLCRECNRERQREYRQRNPDKQREWRERTWDENEARRKARNRQWRMANMDKYHAHRAVYYALSVGKLVRPDACERCGKAGGRIEAHHEDYSKKLEVEWLCPSCHRFTHMGEESRV